MIARRALLASVAAGVAALSDDAAPACSLVPDPRDRFSDTACRRSIADFVRLLNAARTLSPTERAERIEALAVTIDEEVLTDEVAAESDRDAAFYAEYTVVEGRPDPKPARLVEVTLLKSGRGRAIYQFTIRRHRFHPADDEGCNGMFVHDAFFGDEDRAYLGIFRNNALRTLRRFDEWRFDA